MKNPIVLIADGLNLLHRGHYATPPMSNADGLSTNALRGLVTILLADIRRVSATHCAVVFDRPGKPSFRHRLYPEYKANRDYQSGVDVRPLLTPAKRLLNAMGIKVYGKLGVEGDDLIASLAVRLSKKAQVYIDSNDKDFAALVNDRIHLLRPKGVILDAKGVFEEYGVHPHQMVEYLMMLGDTVDNIPGVHKVGKVTAAKLLNKHGSLRSICRNEKFTPAMERNFKEAIPRFKLTRKLITLDTSYLPGVSLWDVEFSGVKDELKTICDELAFRSTYSLIINALGSS